jgi:hypothetical protein
MSLTLFIDAYGNEEVRGIYKYPSQCDKEKCTYFVEWHEFEKGKLKFEIIARNTSRVDIGLSKNNKTVSTPMPVMYQSNQSNHLKLISDTRRR